MLYLIYRIFFLYMKINVEKLGVSLFCGLIFTGSIAVANSWESKNITLEAENWKTEIAKWNTLNEEWSEKRDNYYNKKFKNFSRTRGEYCDEKGCFEEGLFAVEYKNTNKQFKISSMGNFEISIGNLAFNQSNGGQSLEFRNIATHEKWESSNFGQNLEYQDALGNTWGNSNYGQSIEFIGIHGEYWESSNFGQSLEFKDKNGNTWESSNFGQSVENNGQNVDFDIQDNLFNY